MADQPRAEGDVEKCAACGVERPVLDMAMLGDGYYCHPAVSNDMTCYMTASWGSEKQWP